MNALSDIITAQIQQRMTMDKTMSNQDLPCKQQCLPPRASPEGLTLKNVPVLSKSPSSLTVRSTAHGKSSWADQHDDYDDEM
jgi:hypothetical protein